MNAKDKPVKKRDPKRLDVMCKKGEADEHAMARAAISPTVHAGLTLRELNKGNFNDVELMSLIDNLKDQIDTAKGGNLEISEEILISQAYTLDNLFHALTRSFILNMGTYVNAAETYMRLALKAQSQCRTTLEALASIKNPPLIGYVKQANIAHGPQQVNNGQTVKEARQARKNKNPQNKLLEQNDEERLDTGTTSTPGKVNQEMETVGTVNRTSDK